jgi:arylsulfatase
MNAPFRWTKQYASMLGGIRNGMIVSWTGHIRSPGAVCAEFGHVVDIAPTVFDAAHIAAPEVVNGVKQKPLDGKTLLPSLAQCSPERPRTQYFEMIGKAGLYKDGWFASNDDDRLPGMMTPPAGPNPPDRWTLYDLDADFSQSTDVAAAHPDRLKAMVQTWRDEAARNHVFPINHEMISGRVQRPSGRTRYDFWGKEVSIPAHPEGLMGRNPFTGSFSVHAELDLASDRASGVVLALGSHFAGWSLYLDQGRPTFVYAPSMRPENVVKVVADRRLARGPVQVDLTVTSDGIG